MKILVLSDNHYNKLDKIKFNKYDYVIHCGDCGNQQEILEKNNVIYVAGNCDNIGEKNIITNILGKNIYITHGDLEQVKYSYMRLIYKALELKVDIVFFGHTHNPTYFIEENVLFLNPGSYPNSYIEIIDNNIYFITSQKQIKLECKW